MNIKNNNINKLKLLIIVFIIIIFIDVLILLLNLFNPKKEIMPDNKTENIVNKFETQIKVIDSKLSHLDSSITSQKVKVEKTINYYYIENEKVPSYSIAKLDSLIRLYSSITK